MFQDLQLLKLAKEDEEHVNVAWALGLFSKAYREKEGRRVTAVAKELIRELPLKEHEVWCHTCEQDGTLNRLLEGHPGGTAMSGPAVQFVRVCLGDSYRVVTFYEDQPVHELKTLLGALFPGTTAANGQAPVAIERLMDGVVVPLSSATKCPQVMSEGSWELLVSRPNNLTTEKLILQGFLHDLFAHGIVTSGTRQNGAWQRGKRSARNPRTSPLQGN